MVKYVDLFAGLGGMRLGLEQALQEIGLEGKCVLTSEIKKAAITALNRNFPGENINETDICTVDSHEIGDFNILLGGFPCQAFSFAGMQKGFADTRGTLFFQIQRILQERLDEVDGFLLENVEGLVLHDRISLADKEGRTIRTIMNILNNLGFNASYVVLNAADFGVPQVRKRVYIVGCKRRYGHVDLKFEPMPHVGVDTILEHGLPLVDNNFTRSLLENYSVDELNGKALKDKRGGKHNIHSWDIAYKGEVTQEEKKLLNTLLLERRKHSWADIIGIKWMDGMPLTTQQIRTFFDVPNLQEMLDDLTEKKYLCLQHPKQQEKRVDNEGHPYYVRVPDVSKPKGYNIVTGKLSFEISRILDKNKPSSTLVAMDMNTIGVTDGEGLRHLSLREGLRLFGYPDTYSLEDFEDDEKKRDAGYDLIGNTVCVPVVKAVALRLLNQIYPGER